MSGILSALRPAARGIASSAAWRSVAVAAVLPPTLGASALRRYAAAHGLTKQDIEGRVLEVLKSFDKVDESKVWP